MEVYQAHHQVLRFIPAALRQAHRRGVPGSISTAGGYQWRCTGHTSSTVDEVSEWKMWRLARGLLTKDSLIMKWETGEHCATPSRLFLRSRLELPALAAFIHESYATRRTKNSSHSSLHPLPFRVQHLLSEFGSPECPVSSYLITLHGLHPPPPSPCPCFLALSARAALWCRWRNLRVSGQSGTASWTWPLSRCRCRPQALPPRCVTLCVQHTVLGNVIIGLNFRL